MEEFVVGFKRNRKFDRLVAANPTSCRGIGDLGDPDSEIRLLIDTMKCTGFPEGMDTKPCCYYIR